MMHRYVSENLSIPPLFFPCFTLKKVLSEFGRCLIHTLQDEKILFLLVLRYIGSSFLLVLRYIDKYEIFILWILNLGQEISLGLGYIDLKLLDSAKPVTCVVAPPLAKNDSSPIEKRVGEAEKNDVTPGI